MTPEEMVRALEPVYAEWREGRFGAWFDVFAADYEWGFAADFPEGGVGPDPVAQSGGPSDRLRSWLSPWELWRCEAERYAAFGEQVLVLCRYSGVAKGSGLPVEQHGAHLWRMRDGKAVRLEVFADAEGAMRAAAIDSLPGG